LQAAYVRLQGAVHPDRLVNAPASHKRIAMQMAAHVNQAKHILENPLSRAAYLCELGGQAIAADVNTQMPLDFLMQQLEWRETVAQACEPGLSQVRLDMNNALGQIQQHLKALFTQQPIPPEAAALVRQWMFLDKLNKEIPG
jgi:molecular chaperone HscB